MTSRRNLLIVLALGLILTASAATAQHPVRAPELVPRSGIALLDATGMPLPVFFHDGRSLVWGEQGERYSVRISNPSSERVEAVLSIDGRDAISGRLADYRSQRGYIVPGYGSITVEGFRQSLDQVRSFRFCQPERSYTARLGTPEHVGVIGVAFFRERHRTAPSRTPARPAREWDRSAPELDSERSLPSAAHRKARRSGRLGTEYGEPRDSQVVEVSFERSSLRPERISTLRYDDREGLLARGIDIGEELEPSPVHEPRAFPNSRFAEPP